MRTDIETMIRNELMALTRVGWTYHPPVFDDEGKFRLGFPDYEANLKINKRFYDAGVRIFLSNLPLGWVDEDKYCFDSMDETLGKLFSVVPDAYYIPRLRLDPPFAWMKKHPEEICVFSDGPVDPSEIEKLVSEGRVNNTYDMTTPPRPNGLQPLRLEEQIGLQSFSSELWVKDACKALEAAINHILEGPYADRFIGFHICFGGTCELLHWGNGGSKTGDFSTKHTKAFFDWSLEKYGAIEGVRKAWDMPNLTRENAFVPLPSDRAWMKDTPESVYRKNSRDVISADYDLFHSQTVKDAFLELAKTAKRLAPDLAVGVFYGYENYGHEHMDDILSSPYVDYLSAPKPYSDPQPGGRGGSVPKVASIMNKKMFIEEVDNRPHTAWDPRKYSSHINVVPAENSVESANVLWREVCKLEQDNASWWWMEQGDAEHLWYDNDELMEIVSDQVKVHKALRENPAEDICQVLLISDTAANCYGGINAPIRSELLYTGIPFHEYRMSDIDEIDLSRYKLLIFSQPMLLTKEKLEEIQHEISEDCQIIFCNLPGVCVAAFSLDRVHELTGMSVCDGKENGTQNSIFHITSGADETVYSDESGVRIAKKGNIWLMLYNGVTFTMLIDLMKRCGVESVINGAGVVHGNSKLLGVFATREKGISGNVSLPQKDDWYEWFTKMEYINTSEIPIEIAPKECRLFISKSLLENTI